MPIYIFILLEHIWGSLYTYNYIYFYHHRYINTGMYLLLAPCPFSFLNWIMTSMSIPLSKLLVLVNISFPPKKHLQKQIYTVGMTITTEGEFLTKGISKIPWLYHKVKCCAFRWLYFIKLGILVSFIRQWVCFVLVSCYYSAQRATGPWMGNNITRPSFQVNGSVMNLHQPLLCRWAFAVLTRGRLNTNMPFYQCMDSHVKDTTVSPTVLSLTWESPDLRKTVFILGRSPVYYRV